jgi:hypothetical protein
MGGRRTKLGAAKPSELSQRASYGTDGDEARFDAMRSKITGPLPKQPGGAVVSRSAPSIWGLAAGGTKDQAEGFAYGELLDEWHRRHGQRWPAWQCAGCGEPIGGLSALLLADENRVHFGEERECLIRFGRRSGGEAVAGLRALGLEPPQGFELP